MSIVLSLLSAVLYGAADYGGGRAGRAHPSAIVALIEQMVSLAAIVVIVATLGTPIPDGATLLWGGLAGLGAAVALSCLYFAFANGPATVVAPVSAVTAAALPVIVGLTTGEHPSPLAIAGIVTAVIAVALISSSGRTRRRTISRFVLVVAIVARLAGGVMFVGLSRADHDSGLWPLLAARVVSVTALLGFCSITRARPRPRRNILWLAAAIGLLDATANISYLEAVRAGLLSVVAVVSSLYPVTTVALAFLFDHERPTRQQLIGFALAAAALAAIATGRG